jgi:ClpP class serine protease
MRSRSLADVGARQHRFAPDGHLALTLRAFGAWFDEPKRESHEMRDGVAIVKIEGPLVHHDDGWWCDSYEAIKGRVAAAFAAKPKAVVLSLDSPGGLVSGCFETARELRAMSEATGVPLVAYVEGQACSAAYALACAASRIVVPATGVVGSIGVIAALLDATKADAQWGYRYEMVASGARKTDGNPHVAITDDAIAATREVVDSLAELFFGWVSEARPSLGTDALRGLEAGVRLGSAAVSAGLADEVGSLDAVVATFGARSSANGNGRHALRGVKGMRAMDLKKLRKMLGMDDDADEEAIMAELEKRLAAEGEEETDEGGGDDAPEDDEEASARRAARPTQGGDTSKALDLALARIDRLEAQLAKRDDDDLVAMIDRDMAAGKFATADREQYLELARKDAQLYAKLTKNARVVPTHTVTKTPRRGAAPTSALDPKDLRVVALRAAGLSDEKIKARLSAEAEG